jgi:hypothetical protein
LDDWKLLMQRKHCPIVSCPTGVADICSFWTGNFFLSTLQ